MVQTHVPDNDQRLAQLPPGDVSELLLASRSLSKWYVQRELLAVKLLEIGKSILRANPGEANSTGDGVHAQDAVQWMQKAYNMIEQLGDSETAGMAELKVESA
jgi:hypothetical protein